MKILSLDLGLQMFVFHCFMQGTRSVSIKNTQAPLGLPKPKTSFDYINKIELKWTAGLKTNPLLLNTNLKENICSNETDD